MELTFAIAEALNMTPFDVLNQDAENVILTINYMAEVGAENGAGDNTKSENNNEKKVERIKVNSATATGGWW